MTETRRASTAHRRSVPSAAAMVLALLGTAGAALAAARFPDLQPAAAHREMGYLAMDDGVRLAWVAWLPRSEGRFPVLLNYSPYLGGGLDLTGQQGFSRAALEYLRHGYAVVGASIRGTGCSEGRFTMLAERNARDGAAVVEWAGTRPWSTGAVALFGNSYEGISQYPVAAQRPQHLRAIAAGAAAGDPYLDAAYPGGIFNSSFFAYWTYEIQPMASRWGAESRLAAGDAECREIRRRQPANDTFEATRAHPHRDSWWRARDLAAMAARIEVPVFIAQAWQDQQVASSGAIRLFAAVRAPKKMILANGDHGFYGLEAVTAERLRWYERWLEGVENGIDEEPSVTVWFEQRTENGGWKRGWVEDFAAWPPPEAQERSFYLTADGKLRPEPARGGSAVGERRYIYPAGTELIGSDEAFRLPPSPRGSLSYRTNPAEADIPILGVPVLIVYLASERADTDLMAVLHDVDPDGRVQYLQRGFARASHVGRLVDPRGEVESGPGRSHESPQLLKSGEIYEVRVELAPLGHVVRAGHSLELVVAAPSPQPQPDWGLAPVMLPGRNTVHHTSEHRSRLLVPVVPGLRPRAPAPGCGSLPMQPCRGSAVAN